MKVISHLDGKGTRISFELLPPLRGSSINIVYNTIERLLEFNPYCINITYHSEEVVYNRQADGTIIKKVVRKRPGTVGIAAAIHHKYGIDVVPHIICGGFSRQETEAALIDLDFLGIHNLLVLRGDGDKETGVFKPHSDGHSYAVDLVKQIANMNHGKYVEPYHNNPSSTDFCVGVAGYPEKHNEATSFESDLAYLKEKVDAGADYIVTQMFFENRVFYEFVRRCREIGIKVPVIPGIKPVALKKHLEILPRIFGAHIPHDLSKGILACRSDEEVYRLGVDWAVAQSAELKKSGVPAIHYYTMSRSENIVQIVRKVF